MTNLKNLQINFNLIEKIEFIDNLQYLETFWICENKITKIENLPKGLKVLWVAANQIETVGEGYSDITELNISANFIKDFSAIFQLGLLPQLKNLFLNDINFGENPICLMNNYRTFTLHHLPNLELLDNISVSKDERSEIENIYMRKNLFYRNKIKHLNKSSKSIFGMLKCFKIFYIVMKHIQIIFFSRRIKMLEHIQFEDKFHSGEESSNSSEVTKELDNSKEKIRKCFSGIELIKNNFEQLKEFISHINDMMIVK